MNSQFFAFVRIRGKNTEIRNLWRKFCGLEKLINRKFNGINFITVNRSSNITAKLFEILKI